MVAMSHRLRADISTSRRSGSVWGVFVREHRPVIAASGQRAAQTSHCVRRMNPSLDWMTDWSQWLVWCNRPWSWWSRGKKKKSYGCAPQIWWCSLLIVDDVSRLSAEIWQRCTEKDSKPNIFLSLTCGPAARLYLHYNDSFRRDPLCFHTGLHWSGIEIWSTVKRPTSLDSEQEFHVMCVQLSQDIHHTRRTRLKLRSSKLFHTSFVTLTFEFPTFHWHVFTLLKDGVFPAQLH